MRLYLRYLEFPWRLLGPLRKAATRVWLFAAGLSILYLTNGVMWLFLLLLLHPAGG